MSLFVPTKSRESIFKSIDFLGLTIILELFSFPPSSAQSSPSPSKLFQPKHDGYSPFKFWWIPFVGEQNGYQLPPFCPCKELQPKMRLLSLSRSLVENLMSCFSPVGFPQMASPVGCFR